MSASTSPSDPQGTLGTFEQPCWLLSRFACILNQSRLASLSGDRPDFAMIAAPMSGQMSGYLRHVSRIGRAGGLRFIATAVLLFSATSRAGPQSIELSVDRAILTHDYSGRSAIQIFLSKQSDRAFAFYTTHFFLAVIEIRFLNDTLSRVRLMSPVIGGHFMFSAPSDRAVGTLNEDNAAEIVGKLSSGNAKLEIQDAD